MKRLALTLLAFALLAPSAHANKQGSYEDCVQGASDRYCTIMAFEEACPASDAWRIGKRAWKRPDGATRSDRRRYREVLRCTDEPKKARRYWKKAKRKFYRPKGAHAA